MSEALEILKSCDAFLEGHFLLHLAAAQMHQRQLALLADGALLRGVVGQIQLQGAGQNGDGRPSASSKRPAASALASPAWWTAPSPKLRLPSPFWPAP